MHKYDPSESPIGSGLTTKITIRLPRFLRSFPLTHIDNGRKCHDK
jgi:hypothetical protein